MVAACQPLSFLFLSFAAKKEVKEKTKCPLKLISEEDLKKSQQEFASLFRNSPEALVTELFLLLFCLLVENKL